jgi:uncharacterized protein
MTGLRTFFIITLFLVSKLIEAQESITKQVIDFEKIVSTQSLQSHNHNSTASYKDCSNEVQVILTTLYLGYKNFVSSQDDRGCTFYPSCSTYAFQTIKKNGVFEGILDAIDRLTRCNGLSPENYEIDMERQLLIDNP